MKGIRRHGHGWQASVYVAGMPRVYQPFPIDTPEEEMQAWRDEARARLVLQRGQGALVGRLPAGSFEQDAQTYLKSVKALGDYRGRCYDIALWAEIFQGRRTLTIKPHEIRAHRDKWLTVGPKRVYDKSAHGWVDRAVPLAASTVNHRLRALENLYTVLYPQGYNPVRDVPEAQEPTPEDRSVSYIVIDTILAGMPDRGAATKGKRRGTVSIAKAVCRLIAYTGLPPALVLALRPGDINVVLPAVRTGDRKKGKGAAGGWRPLPVDARQALQAFIDAKVPKTFSVDSVRQAWQRACARAVKDGLVPAQHARMRLYDLRHSYATRILEATMDLKATQALLNHRDARTTARYAQRAIPSWLSSAVGKVRLSSSDR
jgi:integrase